ncbi:MAG: c-type cytochrome [Myxococcales bacterium]|jgi:cytochrome c6
MRKIAGFAFIAAMAVTLLARGEVDKKTEKVWKAKCAACHGPDGRAQTDQGKKYGVKDYGTEEFQKAHSDAALKKTILEGEGANMPAYKDLGDQADQLVQLIRGFKK